MFLNNHSDAVISITLTKNRQIEPYSSLHLNDRDVAIIKDMMKRRKSSNIIGEVLRLSNYKIEDSANYNELKKKTEIDFIKEAEVDELFESKINELSNSQEGKELLNNLEVPSTVSEGNVNSLLNEFELDNSDDEFKEENKENELEVLNNDDINDQDNANSKQEESDETPGEEVLEEKQEESDEIILSSIMNNEEYDDIARFDALKAFALEHKIKVQRATTIQSLYEQIKQQLV